MPTPKLVDPARVQAHLPATLDSGDLDALVEEASDYVLDALPNYWPFPAYNDSPVGTPAIIQAAALDYAVFLGIAQAGEDAEQSQTTAPADRRARCDRVLDQLAAGERVVREVEVSGETLTFGTDPLYPDRAFLAQIECEIVEGTTRVDGALYGVDFFVDFSVAHRQWYVARRTSEIVNGTAVVYKITWLRKRERVEETATHGAIEVFRA